MKRDSQHAPTPLQRLAELRSEEVTQKSGKGKRIRKRKGNSIFVKAFGRSKEGKG